MRSTQLESVLQDVWISNVCPSSKESQEITDLTISDKNQIVY